MGCSQTSVLSRYDMQDNPLNPGDTGHLVFYCVMQAVCYILCFTSKRFEQEKNGVQFLRSWDWTRILNSPLDPLRVGLLGCWFRVVLHPIDRRRVYSRVQTPLAAEHRRH